jgi:hypothetical protein
VKRICIGLAAALAFVVFGTATALAQPASLGAGTGNYDKNGKVDVSVLLPGDVQEEVEILRRLLDKSFTAVYGPLTTPSRPIYYKTMGAGMPGMGPMTEGAMPLGSYSWAERAEPDLQGVYLKDYGVVYTVTLPPPPNGMLPGPTAGVVTLTPLSPWERTRKELRGEKIENEGKGAVGSPSLSEVILKVLADNGKHFTRLAEGERITVAVTFRDDGAYQPQAPMSLWMDSQTVRVAGSGSSASAPQQHNPLPSEPGPGMPPSGPFVPGTEWVTNIRNGLTLGDLHVKQKNYSEAIAAYHNAQDQLLKTLEVYKTKNPEDTGSVLTAAHLYLLLARGYESAGDKEAAREAMEKVESLSKMAATRTIETPTAKALPATPPALPSKLVVTASKKLLDEVGAGKMTFEAFRKAATVESVKPPAAEKK